MRGQPLWTPLPGQAGRRGSIWKGGGWPGGMRRGRRPGLTGPAGLIARQPRARLPAPPSLMRHGRRQCWLGRHNSRESKSRGQSGSWAGSRVRGRRSGTRKRRRERGIAAARSCRHQDREGSGSSRWQLSWGMDGRGVPALLLWTSRTHPYLQGPTALRALGAIRTRATAQNAGQGTVLRQPPAWRRGGPKVGKFRQYSSCCIAVQYPLHRGNPPLK